jgi:hypothetical protein
MSQRTVAGSDLEAGQIAYIQEDGKLYPAPLVVGGTLRPRMSRSIRAGEGVLFDREAGTYEPERADTWRDRPPML